MSDPIIQWLPNIPQCPLLQDYRREEVESRLISNVSAGLNKIRNRFLAVPIDTTESFILTRSQYNDFIQWWNTTLRRGALQFAKYEPISDSVRTYRARNQPSVVPIGGNKLKLTLDLEIMP